MEKISFVIPCYNSEAYMEKAIQSILPGGEDVEIIVVNDGSSDGTSEVAKKYEEKYKELQPEKYQDTIAHVIQKDYSSDFLRYDSRKRRLIFIEFEYLGSSHQQSKITFD